MQYGWDIRIRGYRGRGPESARFRGGVFVCRDAEVCELMIEIPKLRQF